MRWILRGLLILGASGFLLAALLEGAAEGRTTLVQWTDETRLAPIGPPERVEIGPVPHIPGHGPEGSVFISERYRRTATPYDAIRRIFLLGKLGSLGLVLVGLLAAGVLRLQRIGLGQTPD